MPEVKTSELGAGNYLLTVLDNGGYRLWKVEDDMTWHGYKLRGLDRAFDDLNHRADEEMKEVS